MKGWKVLALPGLIAALLSLPCSAPAEVSTNIGAAPACPYGYFDYAHTTALHMGTTAPSGSRAVS
jgi:hypothetical protein